MTDNLQEKLILAVSENNLDAIKEMMKKDENCLKKIYNKAIVIAATKNNVETLDYLKEFVDKDGYVFDIGEVLALECQKEDELSQCS